MNHQPIAPGNTSIIKSKVVHVLPCYPPHLGGIEQRVCELSERLAKSGHEVRVITSDQGTYPHDETKGNPKVFYLKSWFLANTVIIPSLVYVLAKQPKDAIVHIHISQALTPEVAFLVAKFRRQQIVIHIRGDVGPSGGKGKVLLPLYKKIFLKHLLLRADKVIVLTQDYSEMINARYGVDKNKIVVIPNATNFVTHKPAKNPPSSRTKLLLVGRLSIQKNIEVALQSVALLRQDNVYVTLSLVGDGELHDKLVAFTRSLKIEDQINFNGRVEGKKLEEAYLQSDIVIQPSRDEGFSTVLLEAMATRKPIIAGNILGTRSIIKNNYNGLLIDPHSPACLADAIKRLINDSELCEKLIQNGVKEVSKYSWDEITKLTEQVYEDVNA